jgi:hypothetical protein
LQECRPDYKTEKDCYSHSKNPKFIHQLPEKLQKKVADCAGLFQTGIWQTLVESNL